MRVLRLLLAYDGTRYQGWQRQDNGPTIQAALEEAFVPLLRTAPVVTGAGRTDAGVHALGQVASVRVDTTHPADAIGRALNMRLASDLRVLEVSDASPEFHARFDAVGKTYRYRIATSPVVSPFSHPFVWHLTQRLDVAAMRRAAEDLTGTHDFSAFQSTGSDVEDAVRTVDRVEVRQTEVELGHELVFDVHGTGFLRHMVRAMVGTLVDVGTGRRAPDSMPALLAGASRGEAGDTAPAQGLTLVSVDYPSVLDFHHGAR